MSKRSPKSSVARLAERQEDVEIDVNSLQRELIAIKKSLHDIDHIKLSNINFAIDIVRSRLGDVANDIAEIKRFLLESGNRPTTP